MVWSHSRGLAARNWLDDIKAAAVDPSTAERHEVSDMDWRRAFLCIASAMLFSLPAVAFEGKHVTFDGPKQGPEILQAQWFRPADTKGPIPVVIALHGCGGSTRPDGRPLARTRDWTERWLAAGYAVLWPDSFGSRGLGPQCTNRKRTVHPRQRARDAQAAARWLASQPDIDAKRIALVGWSNGGSTVLYAVQSGGPAPTPDFRTAIAFYPGCRAPLARAQKDSGEWTTRLPLNILIGAADDWTPAEPCRDLARAPSVRYVEYKGAYHGFDGTSPVRVRRGLAYTANGTGVAHQGTNPEARAAAIVEVTAILGAALK
jgi:dienelactone hydrolase